MSFNTRGSQDALAGAYYNHYMRQQGGSLDVFRGGSLDVFRGGGQGGGGLGKILASAARFLLPIAARTATKFISSAARNVTRGSTLKNALKDSISPSLDQAMASAGAQLKRKTKVGEYRKIGSKKRKVGQYKRMGNKKGSGIKKSRKPKSRKSKKLRYLKTNF